MTRFDKRLWYMEGLFWQQEDFGVEYGWLGMEAQKSCHSSFK